MQCTRSSLEKYNVLPEARVASTSGGTEVCGVKISGGDYQPSVTGEDCISGHADLSPLGLERLDGRTKDSSVYVSHYDIIRII